MKSLQIAAAVLLMTAAGAIAAPPPPEAEAEAEQPAREKKICRTEKITGSLTRVRRTCLTQRQWDEMALNTRRAIEGLERDANQTAATQVPIVGGAR